VALRAVVSTIGALAHCCSDEVEPHQVKQPSTAFHRRLCGTGNTTSKRVQQDCRKHYEDALAASLRNRLPAQRCISIATAVCLLRRDEHAPRGGRDAAQKTFGWIVAPITLLVTTRRIPLQ
jgi:hypothetical protein